MKTILIFFLLGVILGTAAASVIVPPALSWYNEAGFVNKNSHVTSIVNIPDVVRYATNRLIRGQLIGAGIGGVVFLILGIVVASRGPRKSTTPAKA